MGAAGAVRGLLDPLADGPVAVEVVEPDVEPLLEPGDAQRADPLDVHVDVGELARERGQGLVRVLQDRGGLVHPLVLHVVGQHPAAAEGVEGGPVLRAAQHVDRHPQPLLRLEAGVAGLRDLDLLGAGRGQPAGDVAQLVGLGAGGVGPGVEGAQRLGPALLDPAELVALGLGALDLRERRGPLRGGGRDGVLGLLLLGPLPVEVGVARAAQPGPDPARAERLQPLDVRGLDVEPGAGRGHRLVGRGQVGPGALDARRQPRVGGARLVGGQDLGAGIAHGSTMPRRAGTYAGLGAETSVSVGPGRRHNVARVRRAWVVWGVALAAYILAIFHRSSLAVAGLTAAERFDISAAQLATFTMLQLLVYAAMQVPVGVLVDRFGPRTVILTGSLTLVLAQASFALADSYGAALVARLFVGVGDAMTWICLLRLVASWFSGRRVPFVTALSGTLGQLGAIAAAAPMTWALGNLGWTRAYLIAAGVSLLAAAAVAVVVHDTPEDRVAARPAADLRRDPREPRARAGRTPAPGSASGCTS